LFISIAFCSSLVRSKCRHRQHTVQTGARVESAIVAICARLLPAFVVAGEPVPARPARAPEII
jgi:hypothetical protein